MCISAYTFCSSRYFPWEGKSIVTTRRREGTFCIKSNDQRSSLIIGCSIPLSRSNKQSPKLILNLLLISGNVELNPGPTNIKYLCGKCARSVKSGQSVACDQYNVCDHQECAGMNSTKFEYYMDATIEMQWTCIKCELPNTSASLFDSSMSFINSSLNFDEEMLCVKSLIEGLLKSTFKDLQ